MIATRAAVWPFGLVAAGLAVATLVAVRTATTPDWVQPVAQGPNGRLHEALLAAIFLVVAHGLLRRRQVAYWTVLGLAAAGVLLTGPGLFALLLLLVGGILATRRAAFPAVPAPARVRQAGVAVLVVFVAGGLYDVLQRAHPELRADFGSLVLLCLVAGVAVLGAAAPPPRPADAWTRGLVADLVRHPASDTLAPFVLRRDRGYVFSRDGRAAVGYRVLLGVAVVGGDPVGEPEAFPDAVAEFVRTCARAGWRTAALGVREDTAELLRAHGLRTVGIGDEVLLAVAGFGLDGRAMRNVRQAVHRTQRFGVTTAVIREGDVHDGLREELVALAAAPDRGFSMTLDGLLTGAHPDCLLAVAFDAGGRPIGLQRYVPCGDALSLDTMWRARDSVNGVHERLITDLATYARAHGIRLLSLNFAAFRALLDTRDRTAPERLGYGALHLLDPFIHVESLYRFNAKFRPAYLPRAVAFPSWPSVPVVAAAMVGMEFGLPYDRRRNPAVRRAVRPVHRG